jgi:transposase-like protein
VKPRKKTRYTSQEMIDAIQATGGIIAAAARRLGCSRNTVMAWIDKNESVRVAYEDQKQTIGDEMEGRLLKICRTDQHADQFKAIRFYLRTIQRDRGYGDKDEKLADKLFAVTNQTLINGKNNKVDINNKLELSESDIQDIENKLAEFISTINDSPDYT